MGLKGYRLWVMGQLDSTCRAPPGDDGGQHQAARHRVDHHARRHAAALARARHEEGTERVSRREGRTHSRGVSDWLHVRPELDLWVALTPGGWQIG